ncbi:type II toxin-antitoxin system RelE/ParE family toxin [Kovacikia minuta CCNUW1]|uniref:type II toxin-antitoxin system RelE family toxin n=1 Tax=Kovacikia minuta TaxID=2931930 RepID=UPI001CCB6E0C|nr:type II toxin-antitoxin system RelE/ParE family toxin [Kovacikia minuta]UBF24356.1 type II toxin-antitoxin system RelE/ParE family toxin [Kovacikia minuta CCNUW1]
MTYQVALSKRAERQLSKLDADTQALIGAAIDILTIDPRPSGVKKLKGEENVYRIRVRDYRILYEIQDDEPLILVIKIGHRRDVYC